MKKRRFPLSIALTLSLLLAVSWLASLLKTSTAAPIPTADAGCKPFKGKIVMVGLEHKASIPLENARVQNLGDRQFLVGKAIQDWGFAKSVRDQTIWFPVVDVTSIIEFESMEELKSKWGDYMKTTIPSPASQGGENRLQIKEPQP